MLVDAAMQSSQDKISDGKVRSDVGYVREISLPSCGFRDIVPVGIDFGGSLAKIAYSSLDHKGEIKICLATFGADQLEQCVEFIRHHVLAHSNGHQVLIGATGVGSHKYKDRLLSYFKNSQSLKISIDCLELQRGIQGIDFVWQHLPAPLLLHPLSDQSTVERLCFQCPLPQSGLLPCLVASMGSSLLIAKVNASGEYESLAGASTQGGLSLLGLGSLLTSARSFDELVKLAEKGDRSKVDLTVRDVAGGKYNSVPESCLVSSFGQLAKKPDAQYTEADVASSLLYCVTDQMAQTSYLVAQAHSINNIVFYGSYLSGQTTIMNQIKEKMTVCYFVLKHRVNPIFLCNEGHLGALGALVEQHTQHLRNNFLDDH